jgi:hypothetical protein
VTDYIDWLGQTGTYRYRFLEKPRENAAILDVGGNYAFVKKLANGNFIPIYFVADSLIALETRIPTHERFDDAVRAGATHVMAHTTPAGDAARIAEERDLIQRWNPPLNVHLRTTV